MSNYRINTVNTLSTYFVPKGAGLTAAATNIRQAGTDLNALLMIYVNKEKFNFVYYST